MNRYDVTTNALSVYNVLDRARRDMRPPEILSYLRDAWDPDMDEQDMREAVAYLKTCGFVSECTDGLRPFKRKSDRRAARIIRSADRTKLMRAEFF